MKSFLLFVFFLFLDQSVALPGEEQNRYIIHFFNTVREVGNAPNSKNRVAQDLYRSIPCAGWEALAHYTRGIYLGERPFHSLDLHFSDSLNPASLAEDVSNCADSHLELKEGDFSALQRWVISQKPSNQNVFLLMNVTQQTLNQDSSDPYHFTNYATSAIVLADEIPSAQFTENGKLFRAGYFDALKTMYYSRAVAYYFMMRDMEYQRMGSALFPPNLELHEDPFIETLTRVERVVNFINSMDWGQKEKSVFYLFLHELISVSLLARELKNQDSSDQKRERVLNIWEKLKVLAKELKSKDSSASNLLISLGANYVDTVLYYDVDQQSRYKFVFGSRTPIKNPIKYLQMVNDLYQLWEDVRHIGNYAPQKYAVVQRKYWKTLAALVDRLHYPEFNFLGDDEKFKFYEMLRLACAKHGLQQAMYDEGSAEDQVSSGVVLRHIYQHGISLAPTKGEEAAFIKGSLDLLPEFPKGKNAFTFYYDLADSEAKVAQGQVSKRKEKQYYDKSAKIERALLRVANHIAVLMQAGRYDQANAVINGARRDMERALKTGKVNNDSRKKKEYMTPQQISDEIKKRKMQRKAAEEALQEHLQRVERQREVLATRREEAKRSSQPEVSFWAESHEHETLRANKKEAEERRKELEEKEKRKVAAKAAKSASASSESSALVDGVSSEGSPLVGEEFQDEARPLVPSHIIDTLVSSQAVFLDFFKQSKKSKVYRNDVSIKRDDFLNLMMALGGAVDSSKGDGSHSFISLKLGEDVLDLEALDEELVTEFERQKSSSNSEGTMTLSWPRHGRGHNRRFLLPEQIKAARLVFVAAGLTPEVLPKD